MSFLVREIAVRFPSSFQGSDKRAVQKVAAVQFLAGDALRDHEVIDLSHSAMQGVETGGKGKREFVVPPVEDLIDLRKLPILPHAISCSPRRRYQRLHPGVL